MEIITFFSNSNSIGCERTTISTIYCRQLWCNEGLKSVFCSIQSSLFKLKLPYLYWVVLIMHGYIPFVDIVHWLALIFTTDLVLSKISFPLPSIQFLFNGVTFSQAVLGLLRFAQQGIAVSFTVESGWSWNKFTNSLKKIKDRGHKIVLRLNLQYFFNWNSSDLCLLQVLRPHYYFFLNADDDSVYDNK